ncbi:YwqG family protein [uncultured Psychroserpens sp.]|uniref:YwqG family protein n=1 Tax=uncultured Psychroserpens sp. TaxID=255436 RepID=UPI00263277B0|nr:YwqG family protein [uncultured Psychroserpens sp.]
MKTYLKFALHLTSLLMLFGCFGQNSSQIYNQKKKAFTADVLRQKWSEPDKIKSMIEPIIVMNYGRTQNLGSSKLGGTPDLPSTIEWPKFEGHSMVFYGQLNLSDIANLHQDSLLPKTGILYFFSYFPAPESEFGAAYDFIKDKAEYKVIYVENVAALEPTKFPKDLTADYHFKQRSLNFELKFQLPPTIECSAYDAANLGTKDADIYDQLLTNNDHCEESTVLGTPCPIQYGVDFDWAYSYLDITNFSDPKQKESIDKLRPEFINLFSFPMYDIFEKIGYSNCYFGITKEDLKNKNFKKAVFVMQDT